MSVSLPLIVNLMVRFYWKRRILPAKNIVFIMHSREAFFIRLENRTFYGFVSLSASPIAKPFPQFTQFCYAIGLSNTIPNTISRIHGTKNRIHRTSKVNKADTMFDLTFDPAGVEFLGTVSKFRERNKISSLLVYVVEKTRN